MIRPIHSSPSTASYFLCWPLPSDASMTKWYLMPTSSGSNVSSPLTTRLNVTLSFAFLSCSVTAHLPSCCTFGASMSGNGNHPWESAETTDATTAQMAAARSRKLVLILAAWGLGGLQESLWRETGIVEGVQLGAFK